MSLRESIQKALRAKDENSKRLVTVNIGSTLLDRIDRVAAGFSKVNSARNFSRNSIIEMAVQAYIEEAEQVLEEQGVDLDTVIDSAEEKDKHFDLAIFPAHNDGFNKTFLGENKWYSVRIKEDKIPQIKYVACYRAAPVSGITHYAKVKKIKQYEDTDKKEIIFDGEAIELPQAVKLGSTNANAMRAPRYTTLGKLTSASEVEYLFE